jgi:hypothetical protein
LGEGKLKEILCAFAFGAFLYGPQDASASLLGDTITLNYRLGDGSTTDSFLVDSNIEVACIGGGGGNANVCGFLTAPVQQIDIDAFSISYAFSGSPTAFNDVTPNGFEFSSLDLGAPIAEVIVNTDIPGFGSERILFSDNAIEVNMRGLAVPGPTNFFTLNIVPVPVPAGVWLLLSGVNALFALRMFK